MHIGLQCSGSRSIACHPPVSPASYPVLATLAAPPARRAPRASAGHSCATTKMGAWSAENPGPPFLERLRSDWRALAVQKFERTTR